MYQAMDDIDDRRNQRALLEQLRGPGMQAPTPAPAPAAGGGDALPGMAAPPQAKSPFQSGNSSLSGYMQEAAAHFRPELIKAQGDAARKSAAEGFFRSLEPEMRARGWKGGEIKGEKYQDNGRWYDLYRDVEGAADAQHLDVTDGGGGIGAGFPAMQSASGSLNGLLAGDPMAAIQAAIAQYQKPQSNLQALLQQLEQGR